MNSAFDSKDEHQQSPFGGGHIPVLLTSVLQSIGALEGKCVVDCTFGAGGYTRAFLEAGADVIALDRDPDAIAAGSALEAAYGDRLTLIEAEFGDLATVLGAHAGPAVDAVIMDIGVSSMQLDQGERGFAFRLDGPLDMRMSREGMSAADIVNNWPEEQLADLFYKYGEERRARAIARLIADVRGEWPIETTRGLATLIEKLVPSVRKSGKAPIHPATRVFQALRIAVNDELGQLVSGLHAAEHVLKPGGVLSVVTFHSLEDRIVKRFISEASGSPSGSRHLPEVEQIDATFAVEARRPVVPGDEEMQSNPRARSAKLRSARRTNAPARRLADDEEGQARFLGLPLLKPAKRLPRSAQSRRSRQGGHHARG